MTDLKEMVIFFGKAFPAEWPLQLSRWWMTEWWNPLLSWVYPPRHSCVSCGMKLGEVTAVSIDSWFPNSPELASLHKLYASSSAEESDTSVLLCAQCASSITPHDLLVCAVCGRSHPFEEPEARMHTATACSAAFHSTEFQTFDYLHGSHSHDSSPYPVCSDCTRNVPSFVAARSFGQFRGLLQTWVARYKFGKEMELETLLGHVLSLAYWEHYRDILFDAIVPVPLHPSRLRSRGFNQAEQIANYLVPLACAPCAKLLQRLKFSGSQTSHTRSGRLSQANGGYRVDPSLLDDVRDRKVLLIDDVYTTGTTARLCSSALVAAGAASVHVLTLGR